MEQFIGKWKFTGSTNLKEYLNTLDAEDELKDVVQVIKPKLTIFQEGDTVSIHFQSSVLSENTSFKLGEEFQMKALDGTDRKVVVDLEGDKLIKVTKWNQSESTVIYEIKDGQLITTSTNKDAVTVFTFEKA